MMAEGFVGALRAKWQWRIRGTL